MADIRAFRGTFYNPRAVEDISRVIAPPYDIIDDVRKQALLTRSPYNIVRLILPASERDSKFWKTSATLFRAWKKGEVLTSDPTSCLYIYRQSFGLPGGETVSRTGILALLKCKDFATGDILPHEKTFVRTRAERLNLLRSCKANFSQIFTIFRDPGEEALAALDSALCDEPFLELKDDEGVSHRLWRMEGPEDITHLVGILKEKKLIIADGHHRYETALAYSGEDRKPSDTDYPRKYVSVVLFRSEDPGLAVLPVHRLLRRLPMKVEEAYSRLGSYFTVEMIQRDIGERKGMFKERLENGDRPAFIMITKDGAVELVLREGVKPEKILEGPESARWKSLDTSILHSLVMEECMGLDTNELAEKGDLYFTPWESSVLSDISGHEAEAAFLVRPTRIDEIWEIAEGGERMPHKSSYFHPKLPSGLVVYDHENAF